MFLVFVFHWAGIQPGLMNTFVGCLHFSIFLCACMFVGFFLCLCLCFCTRVCLVFLVCVYFVAGMNPVPMNIAIDVVPVFVCKWTGI